MMERIAEVSPRFAGVCEALEGLTAAFGQVVVLGKLVVVWQRRGSILETKAASVAGRQSESATSLSYSFQP
jgi:hypothetical protein